jgi:hypothetical protein
MLALSEVLKYICFESPSHIEYQQIMVTFIEFKRRSKTWQVETVIQQGTAICERWEYDDVLKLYHMGSFYAEIRYPADLSEVFAIECCDSDRLLEPYLSDIEIKHLL